jgi:hypothetical protein
MKESSLLHPWAAWIEGWLFAAEAQWVIALRAMRLAAGGAAATREAQRMIFEKVVANAQAQVAAVMALAAGGEIARMARDGGRPYRRAVRANRKRLTRRR